METVSFHFGGSLVKMEIFSLFQLLDILEFDGSERTPTSSMDGFLTFLDGQTIECKILVQIQWNLGYIRNMFNILLIFYHWF
ncbi:unnamed protein product [Rhizophagus irregularis]|nr:unnamed protein product [Rhizophagus irregularis]